MLNQERFEVVYRATNTNKTWTKKFPNRAEAQAFKDAQEKAGITAVIVDHEPLTK